MHNIVCWKWDNGIHPKKKIKFTHEDVNELYRMLSEKCRQPFRLICITDDQEGIDENIICLPIWRDFLDIGGCFVRLKAFSHKVKEMFGDRFISIDLDCVIVADPEPLFSRQEDFIIWSEKWRKTPYCGSLFMMDTGCREKVYTGFKPKDYPSNRPGPVWSLGTDQARISDCLFPHEATWSSKDGIYNFNMDIGVHIPKTAKRRKKLFDKNTKSTKIKLKGGNGELPDNAIIVFFNGKSDPANAELQEEYSWIREHYKWTRI